MDRAETESQRRVGRGKKVRCTIGAACSLIITHLPRGLTGGKMLLQLRQPLAFRLGQHGTGRQQQKQSGGDEESPPPQRIATLHSRAHDRQPKA